jgi:hypothetical protein
MVRVPILRSVILGIACALVTPAMLVQASAAPAESSEANARAMVMKTGGSAVVARMLHRVVTPAPNAPRRHLHFTTPTTTNIWSGYVGDTTGNDTWVNGTYTYFTVRATHTTQFVTASWVGVGGWGNGNLIQTGVEQGSLWAWYELLPASAVWLFPVRDGDLMFTEVSQQTAGYWFVEIIDVTSGQYYYNSFYYQPGQTSADYVLENQGWAVPSFTPVPFTVATWEDRWGHWLPLTDPGFHTLWKVSLSSSWNMACPTDLGSDGKSFSVFVALSC